MKKVIGLFFLFITLQSNAQDDINIVPMPAELKKGNGSFIINSNTKIVPEGGNLRKTANMLKDCIKKRYGLTLQITEKESSSNKIVLNYERMDFELPGAYTMNINDKEIYIAGDNETGVFYGIQTLIQLLPVAGAGSRHPASGIQHSILIPQLTITDHPRFGYRGMHLDVSRHFFTVDQVKRFIDQLAVYKFNRFHWHLTDDQGWRIEIKKYPELTSVGGYRNGTIIGPYPGTGNDSIRYGGSYSQQQIKDIVKYASERYITIIPEIEMPGHSSAAIAAYPSLSCFPAESSVIPVKTAWAGDRNGKLVQQSWGVFEDVFCPSEYTFKFLEDVLDEIIQLFPSEYIHIGGDESPKESWKRSDLCRQLIKEKKLNDEHGLQSYFISRIERYLESKGKKIIGWDEILEGGIAPNATIMSWRGETGGIAAAKQGHDVIMSPESPLYLNHAQSKNEDSVTQGGYNPLENVYNYDPVPKELTETQAKHILGAQGNMWSEHLKNQSKLEYMLYPRLAALSEVLWSPKEKRNWSDFEKRLPGIFKKLDEQKINYSTAYYDLKASVIPSDTPGIVLWKIESKNKNGRIKWIPSVTNSSMLDYQEPLIIKNDADRMSAIFLLDNKPVNRITQSFHFNKATGKKITIQNQPSQTYPGDGAFTLVNGVQNEKGLQRSSEFLGFSGTDLEAVIDLGEETEFKQVTVCSFTETGSWIYPPKWAGFTTSNDGIIFSEPENEVSDIEPYMGRKTRLRNLSGKSYRARFIKITVKNYGIIPSGNPGSGSSAWLFIDEIEVK